MKNAIVTALILSASLASLSASARPNAGAPEPTAAPAAPVAQPSPFVGQRALIRPDASVYSSVGGCESIEITAPYHAGSDLTGVITGTLTCTAHYSSQEYFVIDSQGRSMLVSAGWVIIRL